MHKVATCTKYTADLVEYHISGMLAVGIVTSFAGCAHQLRKILEQILKEKLRIYLGPPCHQKHRSLVYDAFLDHSVHTSKKVRSPGQKLFHQKQRLILDSLLNGDIQQTEEVQHWCIPLRPRGEVLADMAKHLVPCFIPSVCPKLNRGSWLGYEGTLRWIGLLSCHHGLLKELLVRFCNVNLVVPKTMQKPESETTDTASSWMKAIKDVAEAHAVDPSASSCSDAVVLFGPAEAGDAPQNVDPNASWAEMNKATKQKAAAYAASEPGPTLLAIQACLKPLQRLMTHCIFLASERWTRIQEQTAIEGGARSYRMLDLARGKQLGIFLRSLQDLFQKPMKDIHVLAMTSSINCLCFRLLSRSGSVAQQLLSDAHMTCPFALFKIIDGEHHADELLETEECLRDPLTKFFLDRFPSKQQLTSRLALVLLTTLASEIDVDIAGIECRHAGNRRIVTLKSTQTWRLDFSRLSAEWVVRQQGIARNRFHKKSAQKHQKDPKKKRKRKGRALNRGRGGHGGPWRAFIQQAFRGRFATSDDFSQAARTYHAIKRAQGAEWKNLQELGNVLTHAGRRGVKTTRAFGRVKTVKGQVRLAKPLSNLDATLAKAIGKWRAEAESERQLADAAAERTWQCMSQSGQISQELGAKSTGDFGHAAELCVPGSMNVNIPHFSTLHVPAENAVKEMVLSKLAVLMNTSRSDRLNT